MGFIEIQNIIMSFARFITDERKKLEQQYIYKFDKFDLYILDAYLQFRFNSAAFPHLIRTSGKIKDL